MKILKQLQESRFFTGISLPNLEKLASVCREISAAKKEFLFHEEDPGTALFLLCSGNIQLSKISPEGRETVLKVVQPGEVFGEVVLFERNRYPVTAVALSKSLLIKIPRDKIRHLLEESNFRDDFISMLMQRQRYLADKVSYLTSYDVEDRLRMFLKEHYGEKAEIDCPLSKKDVATAIGTTPESLSRLLLRLKKEGVNWTGKRISVGRKFWDQE